MLTCLLPLTSYGLESGVSLAVWSMPVFTFRYILVTDFIYFRYSLAFIFTRLQVHRWHKKQAEVCSCRSVHQLEVKSLNETDESRNLSLLWRMINKQSMLKPCQVQNKQCHVRCEYFLWLQVCFIKIQHRKDPCSWMKFCPKVTFQAHCSSVSGSRLCGALIAEYRRLRRSESWGLTCQLIHALFIKSDECFLNILVLLCRHLVHCSVCNTPLWHW